MCVGEDGRRHRVFKHLGCEGYYVPVILECAGCTDYGDYGTKYGPFGCEDCGFQGKRRHSVFVPLDPPAYYEALNRSLLEEGYA